MQFDVFGICLFLGVCVWFGLVCFWRTRRLRLSDVFVGGSLYTSMFYYLYLTLPSSVCLPPFSLTSALFILAEAL